MVMLKTPLPLGAVFISNAFSQCILSFTAGLISILIEKNKENILIVLILVTYMITGLTQISKYNSY